ncbi:hypothetical protein DFH08DRAFT_817584 [Mycena albidolilacea]|uniref:Uncharacterized protein n=1 Tax=Mycena albidolilacea TaxID=1033008 RepID=A0AAD7EGV8_9AGAR|nr:hypothetical protein DFH08DRAFT_817584 [Mycena albidolilacea]
MYFSTQRCIKIQTLLFKVVLELRPAAPNVAKIRQQGLHRHRSIFRQVTFGYLSFCYVAPTRRDSAHPSLLSPAPILPTRRRNAPRCPPVAYGSPALVDPPSGVGLRGRPFAEPHRVTLRRSPAAPPPLSLRPRNPTIALTDDALAAARRGRNDVLGTVPSTRFSRIRFYASLRTFSSATRRSRAAEIVACPQTHVHRFHDDAETPCPAARDPSVRPIDILQGASLVTETSPHSGNLIAICSSNAIHRARQHADKSLSGCATPNPAHPHSHPSQRMSHHRRRRSERLSCSPPRDLSVIRRCTMQPHRQSYAAGVHNSGERARWAMPLPSPSPPLPAFVHSTPILTGIR